MEKIKREKQENSKLKIDDDNILLDDIEDIELINDNSDNYIFDISRSSIALVNDLFEIDLKINNSIFIPVGSKHRLENNTDIPLNIIEVQTGTYFGEDDIVRYEDDQDRKLNK